MSCGGSRRRAGARGVRAEGTTSAPSAEVGVKVVRLNAGRIPPALHLRTRRGTEVLHLKIAIWQYNQERK